MLQNARVLTDNPLSRTRDARQYDSDVLSLAGELATVGFSPLQDMLS
jgi:hypothetical protein